MVSFARAPAGGSGTANAPRADRRAVSFPIDPFSKTCLLKGTDELGYLLSFEREIAAFERAESSPSGT